MARGSKIKPPTSTDTVTTNPNALPPAVDPGRQSAAAAATDDAAGDAQQSKLQPGNAPSRVESGQAQRAPSAAATTVRHGRGPLIRDSDDERDADSDDDELLGASRADIESASLLGRTRRGRRGVTGKLLKKRPGGLDRRDDNKGRGAAFWACTTVAVLLAIVLLLVAVAHIWIGHLIREQEKRWAGGDVATEAVKWSGPSRVQVIPSDSKHDGNPEIPALVVEIEGLVGVDVRELLGWQHKNRGNWLERMEDRMTRWTVDRLGHFTVDIQEVRLHDAHKDQRIFGDDNAGIIVVGQINDIDVPLSYPTYTLPEMRDVTLRIPLDFPDPVALGHFGRKVWDTKRYSVRAEVSASARVGLGSRGLVGAIARRLGRADYRVMGFQGKLPDMPEVKDPADLVQLETFVIKEKRLNGNGGGTVLGVTATAKVVNPLLSAIKDGRLPPVAFGVPFQLPVSITLPIPPSELPPTGKNEPSPSEILVAKVVTGPFSFDETSKHARVSIQGHLVSPPQHLGLRMDGDQQEPFSAALSRFFARYLSGKSSKVIVRMDEEPEDLDRHVPAAPDFVHSIARDIAVSLKFPGSNERLQLFRDLKIEDMKIKLNGMFKSPLTMAGLMSADEEEGDLLCSGRVVGEINLPDQFASLAESLDVRAIWPDVYVYDGALPDESRLVRRFLSSSQKSFSDPSGDQVQPIVPISIKECLSAAGYPPSPTPATAFARLHPATMIDATTTHIPANSTHDARTIVSATFIDAPLYLLPGRSDVFRRFVGRILFGGPGAKAKAGVRGVTAVNLDVQAWGRAAIDDMPVEGEFWVGAGGVSSG